MTTAVWLQAGAEEQELPCKTREAVGAEAFGLTSWTRRSRTAEPLR